MALNGDNLDADERANRDAKTEEEADFVSDKQVSEEEDNGQRTEDDVESVDSASLLVSFASKFDVSCGFR